MQIALNIDGKEKTFSNDFINALSFRKGLELNKKLRDLTIDDPLLYDLMIEFVVLVFNKQFTIDEVWTGLKAEDLQFECTRVYNEVMRLGGLAPDIKEGNEEGKK